MCLKTDGTAVYTPNQNFAGVDTFRYTIKDLEGATSNVATVTITVESINDLPIAVNDVFSTLQGQPVRVNLIANDRDPDGFINPQSIVITLNPKSGTIRVHGDGTVTFTPSPSFLGTDTFRYTVRDNSGATSNQAVVTVNVVDKNLPPLAVDDSAETTPGQPVTINLVANDSDPDGSIVPGSVTLVTEPAHGTVANHLDGTVTYTPATGFTGTDVFTYTVRDDFNAVSNVATVTVSVEFLGPPWQNPDDPLNVDRRRLRRGLRRAARDQRIEQSTGQQSGDRPAADPPLRRAAVRSRRPIWMSTATVTCRPSMPCWSSTTSTTRHPPTRWRHPRSQMRRGSRSN